MGDYSFTVQRSPLHSPRSYYGYGPTPTGITIHWWGRMGQDHDNVADYLCRSGGNTSAHEVISDGRVTHLIDFDRAAWHSGSTEGNGSTIGLECRPEMTAGDLETVAQRCADIENQLGRSMYYYGHSDWYATACLPLDVTEVLTRRGWVPLRDVTATDEVASWSMDSEVVTFDRPIHVIDPYLDETIRVDEFETTADHNWITSGQKAVSIGCGCGFVGAPASIRSHVREGRRRGEHHESIREDRWKLVRGDQMTLNCRYPGAVHGGGPGLDLTDDQIRLMVWLQGDGHFMTEARSGGGLPYGAEWHLKKPRKIERLTALLDTLGLPHQRNERANGTVSLRVYGDVAREQVIALLPEKRFGWNLIEMSAEQAEIFLAELLHVDGCAAGSYFCSAEEINLDVVQAVASLNGKIARRDSGNRVSFRAGAVRNRATRSASRFEPGRTTEVGCLTTVNGTLIIRQSGSVVVIGNCPGSYYDRIGWLVKRVNEIHAGKNDSLPEEDDVSADDVWGFNIPNNITDGEVNAETLLRYAHSHSYHAHQNAFQILKAIKDLSQGSPVDVDEDAIVAGVLAGMAPAKLADAIRDNLGADVAREVVDALGERLNGGKA